MNNMLTIEEVKSFLEVEQAEIEKYLKQGRLNAYKIGGTYLRFRKEEVLNVRTELLSKKGGVKRQGFISRVADFWRFNNFYIISLFIIAAVIFAAVKMQ